jgi:tetratricopeptide (TPR) repeat protein
MQAKLSSNALYRSLCGGILCASFVNVVVFQGSSLAQGSGDWKVHLDSGFFKNSAASARKKNDVVLRRGGSDSASSLKTPSKMPVITSSTADEAMKRAQTLMKANKVDDALDTLDAAIKVWPNNYHLFVARSQCYLDVRRTLQATQDLTRALSLAPNDANNSLLVTLHRNRANAFFMLHDYAQCFTDLDAIAKMNSVIAADYFLKASCNAALGNPKLVVESASQGLRLAPADADGYYMRAKAYILLNEKKLGDADFDKAIALRKKL